MPNANIFGSPGRGPMADATNLAGGAAYALSDKETLAKLALTSCFNDAYYASGEMQAKNIIELANKVEVTFLAKLAVYARTHGYMKDAPALLLAVLSKRDAPLYRAAFPLVCNNGKVLRGHVQILRSGAVGRKSLGSAPKAMIQQWFQERSPWTIFRNSTGNTPTMRDVLKMVHLKPATPEKEAILGYIIGKKLTDAQLAALPHDVGVYEAFKREPAEDLPKVPFEFLTSLPLTPEQWRQLALNMSWQQLRQSLNMLAKNKVFTDNAVTEKLAATLRDPERIASSNVFPYQLLMAFIMTQGNDAIPRAINFALQDALEECTKHVPMFPGKSVAVGVDVSGSMRSPITGARASATSRVQCVQVAGLIASTILRNNDQSVVLPFHEKVEDNTVLNPRDSIMTNAVKLAGLPSGGTACSAPVAWLNARSKKADVMFIISDNESWADYTNGSGHVRSSIWMPQTFGGSLGSTRPTGLQAEWLQMKRRHPTAKLILCDLQPNQYSQAKPGPDVLLLSGWSDRMFDIVNDFVSGKDRSVVAEIEAVTFDRSRNPVAVTAVPDPEPLDEAT
jgi:60 kDa SS-A/Ro ribonucleoprotein